MSKIFTPHPYQKIAIDHVISNLRCALWAFMGAGKTVSTLTALEQLSLVEDVFPALVIAPLRVANSVWAEEASRWEHLKHLRVVKLTGLPDIRIRMLKQPYDIHTVNFENIKWLIEYHKGAWPYKTIVVDEASKLAGFRLRQGTQRARALAKVAFRSPRMIELTGTPASNGIENLWGALWFIDQGVRLGRTYTDFMNRWFKQSFDGYSYTPMPHAQKEIEARIKDICLSIRAEDFFPVEEPVKRIVTARMIPKLEAQYKELEKKMFIDLGEHQLEPLNAAAKTNKCLQFASGAVYIDDHHNWLAVHAEKLLALESIIEEANGEPVLVAYNFVSDLERLKRAFPKARVLDKDSKTIDEWNAGQIQLLIAHPASAGHGINLALGGRILVYFGVNWNLEEHEQIAERLGPARQRQEGLNRQVFYYYILTENTIDHLVMERLKSKRSVQDILLEAMSNAKSNSN